MARTCALCGKISMPGFNPQSSGSNRVRAHRRFQPNLQTRIVEIEGRQQRAFVCTRCSRSLSKGAR